MFALVKYSEPRQSPEQTQPAESKKTPMKGTLKTKLLLVPKLEMGNCAVNTPKSDIRVPFVV